jgi:hypothetical protein
MANKGIDSVHPGVELRMHLAQSFDPGFVFEPMTAALESRSIR